MHPLPVHISMIVESFSLLSSIILLTIFINPSVSTRGIKTLLSTYNIKDTKEALKIAKKNSENLGLEIEVLESDKLDVFLKNHIKCDIFLSNPPYVERKEDIFDEVKKYEPMNAVFVENNDIFYEECFKHYKEVMNDKFLMAFEINYDQKERLTNLIGKYFTNDDTKFLFLKDIFGKDRYLIILGGYDVTYFEM